MTQFSTFEIHGNNATMQKMNEFDCNSSVKRLGFRGI